MTGYTALTTHTYVAAYQAELRNDLRNAGSFVSTLQAVNRLAERWFTRAGTFRATRGTVTANQTR